MSLYLRHLSSTYASHAFRVVVNVLVWPLVSVRRRWSPSRVAKPANCFRHSPSSLPQSMSAVELDVEGSDWLSDGLFCAAGLHDVTTTASASSVRIDAIVSSH